jgi:hypothetical protein
MKGLNQMARYIRSVPGYNEPIAVKWRVDANQTINEGDLVQIDSTTRYLQSATATSTTLVGIAQQSYTTGSTVTPEDAIFVTPLSGIVCRIAFDTSGAKKTFADTDLSTTKFALKTTNSVDPNTTASGMCQVVGYDNTHLTVDVIIAAASLAAIG